MITKDSVINNHNKHYWRLFIDGYRQCYGQKCFDQGSDFHPGEAGYIDSMCVAFEMAMQYLDQPITIEFIQYCHQISTSGVDVSYRDRRGNVYDKLFRKEAICCRNFQYAHTATRQGLLELFDRISDQVKTTGRSHYGIIPQSEWDAHNVNAEKYAESITAMQPQQKLALVNEILQDTANPFLLVQFSPSSAVSISETLRFYIERYYVNQCKANTAYEKINNIVRFIQDCEQLHPFLDGNCRTFCMLLLNYLLLQCDLGAAILYDPNRFDGFSQSELQQEVVRGQRVANALLTTGKCLYDSNV